MKRTPEEMLQEVKDALKVKHWNYSFEPYQWFRPDDVCSHSKPFKYQCNKLYKAGLLERMEGGRWGYWYKIRG